MERARLYVSISPDLGAEREVIGRALAALPVEVGWEVAYTPGPVEGPGDPRDAARADVYILVLGEDIRAPMGVEWEAARRARVTPLALLKDAPARTPAGQEFYRHAQADWTDYHTASEIGPKAQLALAQTLLDQAGRFRLSTPEYEALAERVKSLRAAQPSDEDDARSGAGQGGVIFAPKREAGRGGTIVGAPRTRDK